MHTPRRAIPLLLAGLLATIVSGTISAQTPPAGAAQKQLATYTNAQYAFTLQYPTGLTPAPGEDPWSLAALAQDAPLDGTSVVRIMVFAVDHDSSKPYPYPLFFQAYVQVGVSSNVAHCYDNVPSRMGPLVPANVDIGGLTFKKLYYGDAGMMKYHIAESYRIIHDNLCYSVEQVKYGTDYHDENTQPGLSESQLTAYYDEAGVIARSLRFTDSTAAAAAPSIVPPDAVTLKFLPGATRIVTKGSLDIGQTLSFVVGAGAGQPLELSATGQYSDPALIVTSLPDGTLLQSEKPWRSSFTKVLKSTQNFLAQLTNGGLAGSYTFTVVVPAPVPIPGGVGSAARSGPTPAGYPVDYLLHARAGEHLTLALQAPGAALQVKELQGGSAYLSASSNADHFSFAVPADGDYVVSIVPHAGSVVRYRITFNLAE